MREVSIVSSFSDPGSGAPSIARIGVTPPRPSPRPLDVPIPVPCTTVSCGKDEPRSPAAEANTALVRPIDEKQCRRTHDLSWRKNRRLPKAAQVATLCCRHTIRRPRAAIVSPGLRNSTFPSCATRRQRQSGVCGLFCERARKSILYDVQSQPGYSENARLPLRNRRNARIQSCRNKTCWDGRGCPQQSDRQERGLDSVAIFDGPAATRSVPSPHDHRPRALPACAIPSSS